MTTTETVSKLQEVSIGKIDRDIENHRLFASEERVRELADSIKHHGLKQPICVYKKKGGRFTLGFGFRRLAAHELLGRKTILAFVEPAAEATEIRAVQAIENLHRRDLHPLEEAEALSAIFGSKVLNSAEGDNVAECAARIGRNRTWVENRLALLRLSPRVRKLLQDGDIYLGHAQLIARLVDHDKQDEIAGRVKAYRFKGMGGDPHDHPPRPLHDCKRWVEAELRDLSKTPWKLDAEFGGFPACSRCVHNSSNTLGLFDDPAASKPQCLNAKCFGQKSRAASNATRKAVNTIVKANRKATPSSATKAMEEREVVFLRPAAVVKAAKRSMEPEKETASERLGYRRSQAEMEQMRRFHSALREWVQSTHKQLVEAITSTPSRAIGFAVLSQTKAWHDVQYHWSLSAKEQKKALNEALKLAGMLREVAEAVDPVLGQFASCMDPEQVANSLPDNANEEGDFAILDYLAKIYGIDLAKVPAEADFAAPANKKEQAA